MFKCIKLFLPDLSILIDPVRNLIQFLELDFAQSLAALMRRDDQPAFGKDLDMSRYGRSAYIKIIGYTIEGEFLLCQQAEYGSPVGIGYCLENVSSHFIYVTVWLHI